MLKLNIVVHAQDCQDGSYAFTLYNNKEELAKELLDEDADITVDDIEDEDDPYENGTLSSAVLDIELYVDADGKQQARLVKSVTLSSD